MTEQKQNRVAVKIFFLILFFPFWLPSNVQPATTLYVSDTTLEANLRSGTSQESRIIGMLRPGTKLTLTGEQDGWAEVTLEDGRTGWILKRYLSERPPWRQTAEQLQKENERLRTQLNKVRTELQQIKQESAEVQRQLDSQEAEFKSVQSEYEELRKSSTSYLNLKMAYENLQNEARQREAKLDELEKAYGKLKTSKAIRWFLSGAGVLMLGWIVGSSMARIRRRRSSDYYKL
jgi:SH3 domain protein